MVGARNNREMKREGDVSQAWKEDTARAKSGRRGPCLACGSKVRGPGGCGKGPEWSEKGQSRRWWGQGGRQVIQDVAGLQGGSCVLGQDLRELWRVS